MRRIRTPAAAFATIAVLALLGSCGDDGGEDLESEVRVVVTLPLFGDMVEEIGGGRVQIDALLPPGADPHTFEPVPSDIQLTADADIVFANGLGLEEATIELIDANLPSDVRLVELAEEAVALGHEMIEDDDSDSDEDEEGDEHEGGNPHMWLDPEVAKEYANIIQEQLSIVDPDGASIYGDNYERYWEDIDDADTYLKEKVAGVPEAQRVIVSTHDAFPYLARAIGFQIGAVVSVSPGQDASPQTVANLEQTIKESRIRAVFREPQLGSEADVLEQAASDAGVEVCILYSDSLEEEANSYIEIIRKDADEIARCLGG